MPHPLPFLATLRRRLLQWWSPQRAPLPDQAQARRLLAAIDAGGVPLHPGRINAIARALGLEVSGKAPMSETIERIRQAVARNGGGA